MNKSVEKVRKCYVICSIDLEGKVCYLKSLGSPGRWEIVIDIEQATRCYNKNVARLMLQLYEHEMQSHDEFVIIPLEIEYRLINEER